MNPTPAFCAGKRSHAGFRGGEIVCPLVVKPAAARRRDPEFGIGYHILRLGTSRLSGWGVAA